MWAVVKWLLIGAGVCCAISATIYLTLVPYGAIVEAVAESFRNADREWYAQLFLGVAGVLMLLVVIIVVGDGNDEHMGIMG